jgi:hypothetical protein
MYNRRIPSQIPGLYMTTVNGTDEVVSGDGQDFKSADSIEVDLKT